MCVVKDKTSFTNCCGLSSHAFPWMLCFVTDLPPPPLTPADSEDRDSRRFSIDEGLHVYNLFKSTLNTFDLVGLGVGWGCRASGNQPVA